MTDEKIVDLYWDRSENAIVQTAEKYGGYCRTIAYNILKNNEDSEECVSDTYLSAWNSMPAHRPRRLGSFLGRITRNIALERYEYNSAKKRRGSETDLVLDELMECIPDMSTAGDFTDAIALRDILNRFTESLGKESRNIFLGRYWFMYSVKQLAEEFGISESKVKVLLYRSRQALKLMLEKEGISI